MRDDCPRSGASRSGARSRGSELGAPTSLLASRCLLRERPHRRKGRNENEREPLPYRRRPALRRPRLFLVHVQRAAKPNSPDDTESGSVRSPSRLRRPRLFLVHVQRPPARDRPNKDERSGSARPASRLARRAAVPRSCPAGHQGATDPTRMRTRASGSERSASQPRRARLCRVDCSSSFQAFLVHVHQGRHGATTQRE